MDVFLEFATDIGDLVEDDLHNFPIAPIRRCAALFSLLHNHEPNSTTMTH